MFDDVALFEVFFHHFGDMVLRHLRVKRPFGVDDDDGPQRAQPETAGHDHLDVQLFFRHAAFEFFQDLSRRTGSAARAAADEHRSFLAVIGLHRARSHVLQRARFDLF